MMKFLKKEVTWIFPKILVNRKPFLLKVCKVTYYIQRGFKKQTFLSRCSAGSWQNKL